MGVSYGQILGYTFIPLAIMLAYTWWYIFTKVPRSLLSLTLNMYETLTGVVLSRMGTTNCNCMVLLNTGKAGAPFFFPWFLAMSIYYVSFARIGTWGKWLDGKFAIIATIVLAFGGIVGQIKEPVMAYLNAATPDMLIPASLVAMVAAYIMGSSGKYAGMTSALGSLWVLSISCGSSALSIQDTRSHQHTSVP